MIVIKVKRPIYLKPVFPGGEDQGLHEIKVVVLAGLSRGHQVRDQNPGLAGPAQLDRIEDHNLVPRDEHVQPRGVTWY